MSTKSSIDAKAQGTKAEILPPPRPKPSWNVILKQWTYMQYDAIVKHQAHTSLLPRLAWQALGFSQSSKDLNGGLPFQPTRGRPSFSCRVILTTRLLDVSTAIQSADLNVGLVGLPVLLGFEATHDYFRHNTSHRGSRRIHPAKPPVGYDPGLVVDCTTCRPQVPLVLQ